MGKMVMALKKLGNKLTGKTIESDNTVGVINEMADKYEGGGSGGGKKTRTLALSGDVQCYSGYVQFIYESEDDTVSYSYDGEAETNPILTHLMSELTNGREIHGYGYWKDYTSEYYQNRHPLKLYINTDGAEHVVMFEALDDSIFYAEVYSFVGCDVIND